MFTIMDYRSLSNLVTQRNIFRKRNGVSNPQFDEILKDTFEIVVNRSYGGYGLGPTVRAIMTHHIEDCGYEEFALKYGFDLNNINNEDYFDEPFYKQKGENSTLAFLLKSSFYRTSPFFISCVKELKTEYEGSYEDKDFTYGIYHIPLYLASCARISEYISTAECIKYEYIKYEPRLYYEKAIQNLTSETIDDLKLFQQVFDYYLSRR
jgi:hypothetical protein